MGVKFIIMEYENFIIERNVKMINLLKEIQVNLNIM